MITKIDKAMKKSSLKRAKPSTYINYITLHGSTRTYNLMGMYEGSANKRIFWTNSVGSRSTEITQVNQQTKTATNTFTSTISFPEKIKKVLYNGTNSLRINNTGFITNANNVQFSRVSIKGNEVAMLNNSISSTGIIFLDRSTFIPNGQAITSGTGLSSIAYSTNTNEIGVCSNTQFLLYDAITKAPITITPAIAVTSQVLLQDNTYRYVASGTSLTRIDKATRVVVGVATTIASSPTFGFVQGTKMYLQTATTLQEADLSVRPATMRSVTVTTGQVFGDGSKVYYMASTGVNTITELDLATFLFKPMTTPLANGINCVFVYGNRVYVGHPTSPQSYSVYSLTQDANGQLPYLYTADVLGLSNFFTGSLTPGQFTVEGNDMFVHTSTGQYKFELSPTTLTINGLTTTANDIAINDYSITISYTGTSATTLHNYIPLILEME